MRPPPLLVEGLLLMVGLSAAPARGSPSSAAAADATTTTSASTASVFLPGYRASAWTVLRGSIVASNSAETTYTIFCADKSPQSCEIAKNFPFTFAEGPSTLHFEGSSPGTITVNLECQLTSSTAAACTGYSSLAAGFTEGRFTGPTETRWTSTFTGSAVRWGALTLTTPPATTAAPDVTDVIPSPTGGSGMFYTSGGPAGTSGASALLKGQLGSALALRWVLAMTILYAALL